MPFLQLEVAEVGRQLVGAGAGHGFWLGHLGPVALLRLRPEDLGGLRAEV